MLLRNLENQSGMKWNILLILSALFCKSAGDPSAITPPRHVCPLADVSSTSKSPQNNVEIDMFILGSDGFKGYMKTGICKDDEWEFLKKETVSSFQCSSLSSGKKLVKMSVFPIVQNVSCIEISQCTTHSNDCGVILSGHSPYKLKISRFGMPKFVCLIEGNCRNDTLTNWITEGCKWTNKPSKYFEVNVCNMTCLNPKKKCENTQYDNNCSGVNAVKEGNINNIWIHDKSGTCYKCGSPLPAMPKIGTSSNKFNTNKKEIDAAAAAEAMKNLSSILSLMENLTVASISMGNVKGVLKKIQTESKITTSYFIYSSETGISVIDDLDELNNYPNAFSIPAEAAEKALNQSAGSAFIGVFRFPNMTKDAENSTVLNDEVYAVEMGTKISNLSDAISLTFRNNQQTVGDPVCKSWDGNGSQPNWTTEGCRTIEGKDNITCECEHLTFFAVLMMPPNATIPPADLTALTYITYIGCGLSVFFLSIGLFMHFLMRKVKATDSLRVLINLFVALFLLNVAFLSNEYVARANNVTACRVMAGFMHYCLLSSFTWFAVEAFHLCLQMAKHSVTIKHYIIKISVVGWAPPALVVSIVYALGKYGEQTITTDKTNVTTSMCWILDSDVHYYVNIGYYCFIFIFTFSTFIVVLRWLSMLKLSRLNNVGKVQRSRTATSDITTILGLCCMLGLTWSFAFFSYGALRLPSYYIFTILNSSQGFFLFIYYLKASSLLGDSAASEESDMTENTNTENPYEDLPTEDTKKAI